MSRSDWALLVGVVFTLVSFVLLVPQILRLLRTGRAEGVSATWAALGATINLGWLAFVVAEKVWIGIPSILVSILSFALTLMLLRRNGARIANALSACIVAAVFFAVVQLGFGWTALGTTLALSYIVQFTPSVTTAWRTHVPVALSPATWSLGLAESAGWSLYGVLIRNGPIILFGLVNGTASLLVLLRIWFARDRVRAELERTR